MSNPQQLMQLFTALFYSCIGIMVLGFGFAIFTFFKFNIPAVRGLMTGKIQKKTIEQIKSGEIQIELDSDPITASTYNRYAEGLTGDFNTRQLKPQNEQVSNAQAVNQGKYDDQTTVLDIGSEATTVLTSEATTVLSSNQTSFMGADETTILSPDKTEFWGGDETSILKAEDETLLDGSDYSGAGATVILKRPDNFEETPAQAEDVLPNTDKFRNTEHTIVIHTDEII